MTARGPETSERTCAWRDSAWGFVLGSTSAEENDAFLEHLVEGCATCGGELERARRVVANLDVAVADRTLAQGRGSTAGPEVRARLLASIQRKRTAFGEHASRSSERPLRTTELQGVAIAPGSDAGWSPTQIDGIEFKTLVEDPVRRTATALVRMAPGTAYPPHRHAAREECYVISGDLSFGEQRMEAGDYLVAEEGSIHPVQATEHGCTLLIVSSMDDEPV